MRAIIAVSLLLGGCATSVGGIRQEPVFQTYTSTKEPRELAQCLQGIMPGVQVDLGENYYSVSNRNGWGSILINWYITQREGGGSNIEVRRTNSIAPGINRATECFE